MSTQGERIEALETKVQGFGETLIDLGEKMTALADTLEGIKAAQDAEKSGTPIGLNAFTEAMARVSTLGTELEEIKARLAAFDDVEVAELELVEGFDAQKEILLAQRRIEFIANSLNIGLPS